MPVCTDQYKLLLRITGLVKKFCEERVNNNVRSSRGTSSQAGLAAKWVITRCTTRSVPVPGATIRPCQVTSNRCPARGPAPEGNPGHAGLELWVAVCGHQVVSGPAVSPAGAKDEEG